MPVVGLAVDDARHLRLTLRDAVFVVGNPTGDASPKLVEMRHAADAQRHDCLAWASPLQPGDDAAINSCFGEAADATTRRLWLDAHPTRLLIVVFSPPDTA